MALSEHGLKSDWTPATTKQLRASRPRCAGEAALICDAYLPRITAGCLLSLARY